MDTLISNVTVVTMNERMDVLFGGYIGVSEGKISYVGKTAPEEKPLTIIDGTGMVAMPGLINCHTHLASTVLRSLLDDSPAADALKIQLDKESKMDARSAKAAALLAIAECLRFGITSVSDLYYYPEATAQAVAESGIKANIALSANRFIDACEDFDFETDEQCVQLRDTVQKWNGYDDGRIRIDCGIYAEYTSNYKLWEALADYAAEKDLGMQLHLAQTRQEVDSCVERSGLEPAELLNCHRMFATNTVAAGCAYLSESEIALLGKKKVSVAAMPTSYAKTGTNAAFVLDCIKAGMNVALGTGGVTECGNMDLFACMQGMALSVQSGGKDAMPTSAPLMMATVCGAQAQGRAKQCGMIKEGMDADVILVDFSAPHLMPCHNVLNALVYSAKGSDVAMTMVKGKVLYQNGKFLTIDLKAVVEELTDYAIPRLFAESKE